MKKIFLMFLSLSFMLQVQAQDITDALRYSDDNIQGTARFRALSGAFGALGGDMSAVSINPAGSSIFNSSSASISFGYFANQNDVGFGDGVVDNRSSQVDVNQLGGVFVFNNANSNSKWTKFAIGAAYDTSRDFDENWVAQGSSSNGLDSYFLNRTNAIPMQLQTLQLFPGEFVEDAYIDIAGLGYDFQQAFLGYQAGIIDPVDANDPLQTNYISATLGDDLNPMYNQRYSYNAAGYNGKFAFNFSTSYDDRLYLGLNLNVHLLNYERTTFYDESNTNSNALVNSLSFDNSLLTTGAGFSFQLGAIAKITDEFRAGLSYNSPTWFRIDEELIQGISSDNPRSLDLSFISTVINIFPTYRLQTPGRLTGSLAYVFDKKGLISFDYSMRDFSQMELRPTNEFNAQNFEISDLLDTAISYKIGGEYRIKDLSLRGGYRFDESPYKDDTQFGDLTGYSLGLGYNFGGFNLDLAFSQSERDTNFRLFDAGNIEDAQFQSRFTDVILTATYNL